MAKIPGSISITGLLAPNDSLDTYAITDEKYNRGGYRAVSTPTERDNIPQDRRSEGMLVKVLSENKFYTLSGGVWVEQVMGGTGGGGSGTPGVSVTNATINVSGHLIITLSDNTTIDAGVAVGPQGATGAAGATGATGNGIASTSYNASTGVLTITYTSGGTYSTGDLRGAAGATGAAGSKWYNGAGTPSAGTGVSGDYYLNTTNGDVYVKTTSWALLTNIKGATGATGSQGPQGAQGPAGAKGDTGATGAQGPAGAAGKSVLYGAGVPAAGTGNDGDFYINTSNNYLYGPKAAGTWPSGISIVGPQGATGAQGPQGIQGIQGPEGPAGPSTPQVINDNSITNAKLTKTTVAGRIKGSKTSGDGSIEDLTPSEAMAVIGVETDPIPLYCSDMTSDLTASTTVSKLRFMFEEARTLQNIVGSLATAATGSVLTVDIKKNGTSIFSTLLTFDSGENTTRTAAIAAVLTGTIAFAVGDYIDIYVTTVGSVTAGKGLLITLLTKR